MAQPNNDADQQLSKQDSSDMDLSVSTSNIDNQDNDNSSYTSLANVNISPSSTYPCINKPPPPPPRKTSNSIKRNKPAPPPQKQQKKRKKQQKQHQQQQQPPPQNNDNSFLNKGDDEDSDIDIDIENDNDDNNDDNKHQSTASVITTSAYNLFASAKKGISRGAKAVSNKSSERLSLSGQLKQARISLARFVNPKIINKEISDKTIPQWVLRGAKGIVFLTVVKAGFLLAGSVGTGCVIVKTNNGWSGPSSIGVAGLSAGLLVGASKIDYIMILPNINAVKQFTGQGQFRLGGEFQLAVGPVGRDASGSVGTGDKGFSMIYSYSHAAGLYGGLGLDGKVISVRPRCNEEFYSKKLTVEHILTGKYDPKQITNSDFIKICHLLDAYCIDDPNIDEKKQANNVKTAGLLFGVDPLTLECTKLSEYNNPIPNVLIKLKSELFRNEGHLIEGIFRIAPLKSKLRGYKLLIDDNKISEINFDEVDGQIIACLIKVFYRELPSTIFHNIPPNDIENCETVTNAQNIINHHIIEPYKSLYFWLLDLVIDISGYHDYNFMSSNNLCIVIAPNLLDLSILDPLKSVTITSSLVTFMSLCIKLRKDQNHLKEANKLLNNDPLNPNDGDNDDNDHIDTPKKPSTPL